MLFNPLRIEAARRLGIDPDRISISATGKTYNYVVTVQGAISRADEQDLRSFLNSRSPAHVSWKVTASFSD